MNEPIHEFFSLSYSNYLVLPRSVLQSMDEEWQRAFVELIEAESKHVPPEGFTAAGPWRVRCNDGLTLVWERPLVKALDGDEPAPSAGYSHHWPGGSTDTATCGRSILSPDGAMRIWTGDWSGVDCPHCLLRQPRQP